MIYNPWSWQAIFARQARVSSQNGEDGVLLYLLELLGWREPVARRCFEIGASLVNGNLECCTAVLLNNGWQGVILDQAEIVNPFVRQQRVTSRNVADVMSERLSHDEPPEVVALDIDGQDYWVWKAMPQYGPAIQIVEYNAHRDPIAREAVLFDDGYDLATKWHDWDGSDYFGASAGAMLDLGHAKGYKLACVVNCLNMFFVRADLVPPGFEEYPLELCGPIRRHPTDRSRPWVKV